MIQAYLYRSKKDIEMLNARGVRVRLCKGAYLETGERGGYPQKSQADANYVELMQLPARPRDLIPAIATHDEKMIAATQGLRRRTQSLPRCLRIPDAVRDSGVIFSANLRKMAIAFCVLYVPFGSAWYPYYMRRLAERPANVLFILRNMFK